MYTFLNGLLADKKGGEIFTVFSSWHFFYIALAAITVWAVWFSLKNKDGSAREKTVRAFINVAFCLYVSDFFLMPFAYGEIDIEKLPFHACTSMCVLCFLSYHNRFLEKYRFSFVLLGFVSNLVYLVYPAGVMWHGIHPLSYRVIQTLIFHSVMTVYGLLTLIYEYKKFDIKKCYRDLAVVLLLTVWALIGNYAYTGTLGNYSHFFNWFFVVRDPFYAIPESISPFIMPFLTASVFFAAEMVIQTVILTVQKRKRR